MFIVDLRCEGGHDFEGWYDSRAEFDALRESDDVTCPLCGTHDVRQLLSATPYVGTSSASSVSSTSAALPAAPQMPTPPPMPLEMQKALSDVLTQVRAHCEDAGDQFAKRALAMHKGEEEHAPIYGTSTPDEDAELRDEGVPVVKLPIPDIDVN